MQVSKWGNSLAIRLPATLVKHLELKVGDSVELEVVENRTLGIGRDQKREQALEGMRRLSRQSKPLAPGHKFNREELYER
jgi:antitoxin MazE